MCGHVLYTSIMARTIVSRACRSTSREELWPGLCSSILGFPSIPQRQPAFPSTLLGAVESYSGGDVGGEVRAEECSSMQLARVVAEPRFSFPSAQSHKLIPTVHQRLCTVLLFDTPEVHHYTSLPCSLCLQQSYEGILLCGASCFFRSGWFLVHIVTTIRA